MYGEKRGDFADVGRHMRPVRKIVHVASGAFATYEAEKCLTVPGKDPIYGEVLKRQEILYAAMGVEPPRAGFSL